MFLDVTHFIVVNHSFLVCCNFHFINSTFFFFTTFPADYLLPWLSKRLLKNQHMFFTTWPSVLTVAQPWLKPSGYARVHRKSAEKDVLPFCYRAWLPPHFYIIVYMCACPRQACICSPFHIITFRHQSPITVEQDFSLGFILICKEEEPSYDVAMAVLRILTLRTS